MPEMFNGQVDGKELPVKRAVSGFCRFQLFGKVGDWTPIHMPLMSCWRTAPRAVSEASVTMQVGADGLGWFSRVASARASLALI